jgi:hypothetical protein
MEKDADGFFVPVGTGVYTPFNNENRVLHVHLADAPKAEVKAEPQKPAETSTGE